MYDNLNRFIVPNVVLTVASGDDVNLLLHWNWDGVPPLGAAPEVVFDRVILHREGAPAEAACHHVHHYCTILGVHPRLVQPLLLSMLGRQALDRTERVVQSSRDPAADDNMYGRLMRLALTAPGPVPGWSTV